MRANELRAIAVWSAVAAAGGGLGPLIGGVLLEHFWWGSVFLVNVPIVLVIIGIGSWALRESKNPNPGPIDIPSVILSMVAVLGTIAGIKDIAIHGFSDPYPFAYLAIGLIAGYLFVRRQLHLESPLIDMALFQSPRLQWGGRCGPCQRLWLDGVYFFLAQQFQLVQRESPLQSGFQLLPAEVAALVGAFVAARVIRNLGRRAAVVGGIALGAIGLLRPWGDSPRRQPAGHPGDGLCGPRFRVFTDSDRRCDSCRGAARTSWGCGCGFETAYELGAALGIAILGSILGAWYRHVIVIPPVCPPMPRLRWKSR